MKKINKKGFTLTELIVVIAVIAILAAVLIPTLTGYIEKARVSADNQEVAVLNKLLLDAEINEIELENVPQLKKYLEEEMEYDGDYSLGVKGSYLFYDKEKYKFVIVKEDEVDGLKMMANDYALATTLTSPEGLLVDNDGNEVLLVGGNGDLVELVESIRNVGNTGQSVEVPEKLSADLKAAFKDLFENYVFYGTKGIYYQIAEDGTVTTSEDTSKNIISSVGDNKDYTLAQLRAKFHSEVILANLGQVNESIASKGELIIDENNPYFVTVKINAAGLTQIMEPILNVISLLSNNGATDGYILPTEFKDVETYTAIITKLIEGEEGQSAELVKFKNEFVSMYIAEEDRENIDTYTKVDLSVFKDVDSLDPNKMLGMVYPIIVALNLYTENPNTEQAILNTRSQEVQTNIDLLKDKHTIRIIGTVNYGSYGTFDIQYDFEFDTSALN